MRVALSEVLGALSYALDITEGEPPGHAVRTTAIGMRLGEQIGLDEDAQSALFYALLLKDAGCSSNAVAALVAVRRARPPGQARDEAHRLVQQRGAGALHGPQRGARRGAARQGPPVAPPHAGGGGHARGDRHPLRARRRDRPHAGAPAGHRRPPSGRWTSTGTAPASRTACAGRRSRCWAASSAWPRPSRSSCARSGFPARWAWRSSGGAAGSTPRSSTRCSRSVTTAGCGARSRTRARSRRSRSGSPPTACAPRARTTSTASPRPSPA